MLKKLLTIFSVFLLSATTIFLYWYWRGKPIELSQTFDKQKLECVSYTPFINLEGPWQLGHGLSIPRERLEQDIALLSSYSDCVRVYSIMGLEELPQILRQHNMKLLIGAWVNSDRHNTEKEIRKVVRIANTNRDVVRAIVVGNETLLRKEVTAAQLNSYIEEVRRQVSGIPLTYADVWEFWLEYPTVAPHVDFITIHILPYWENSPASIDKAINHVATVREKISSKFPGKDILIGETGWPSYGRAREVAYPSLVNEARYLRQFVDAAKNNNWRYNIIEAFDQPWKRGNEGAVGGAWGIFTTDRQIKPIFENEVSNEPNWFVLMVASEILFVIFYLLYLCCRGSFYRALPVLTIAPVALIAQLHQFLLINRDSGEWLWAIWVLGLAVLSLILSFLRKHESRNQESRICIPAFAGMTEEKYAQFQKIIEFLVLFSFALASMGFVFDARYRSFAIAGFLVPLVSFFLSPKREKNTDAYSISFAILFIFTSIFIFINETPLNWQSNFWVLVTLGYATHLFSKNGFLNSWVALKENKIFYIKLFLLIIISYFSFSILRYGIMESTHWVDVCSLKPENIICQVKETIGISIYYQFLAKASILMFFLSYVKGGGRLALWSIIAAIGAMTLYQVDLAAFGFLMGYLKLTGEQSDKAQ